MCWACLRPVLSKLSFNQPTNVLVENESLTYFVFTIMAMLLAPFLFVPYITATEKFKNSLYNAVKD
jgi:hypothetical protein